MGKLNGKKVAVLVDEGFEQIELTVPVERLRSEGADVKIVSPKSDVVKAWDMKDWGKEFPVDVQLDDTSADEFDALLLPGGVMNPDKLRMRPEAVSFVRMFWVEDKPIAAICHAPWTLIEAGVTEGRRMTSYPALRTDLMNSGADWIDEPVVVDTGLVTSRSPKDLEPFCEKMVEEFMEGKHPRDHSDIKQLADATRASV